jgi:hypothetical protein
MIVLLATGICIAENAGSEKADRVLYYDKGVPVTCKQLTELTYRQGLRIVDESRKYYHPGAVPSSILINGQRFEPEGIRADCKHPLEKHYHEVLSSMIGIAIGEKVWEYLSQNILTLLRTEE